jgi:hypothetical protein
VATFITRVELHGATYQDYLQLHGFMAHEGFTATIKGDNGIVYQLPPAEYRLEANCSASDAREKASRAAQKTQKGFAVLVSEYATATWSGLNQIPVRAIGA